MTEKEIRIKTARIKELEAYIKKLEDCGDFKNNDEINKELKCFERSLSLHLL
jgi:hypothetical protein